MSAVVDVFRHITHEILGGRHGSGDEVHKLPCLKVTAEVGVVASLLTKLRIQLVPQFGALQPFAEKFVADGHSLLRRDRLARLAHILQNQAENLNGAACVIVAQLQQRSWDDVL